MAAFDYSNTILIIKPVGAAAMDALRSKHNVSRLASFYRDDAISTFSDDSRSRECTPYVPPPPEIELRLGFKPTPKISSRGFVFGVNEEKCDVVLVNDQQKSISGEHFSVDFNWNSGYLRLNNVSRYGTGVWAPSVPNGYRHLKHNNMHALQMTEQTRISVGSLQFDLSIPLHDKHEQQYLRNWEAFRARCSGEAPELSRLNLQSKEEITRFYVRRKGQFSDYYLHDEIGSGNFGTVCKASHPDTGDLFAAKIYKTSLPKWETKAYLEIAMSRKIVHDHIVRFVDFIDDDGGPVLVMEYMFEGNLMQSHLKEAISLDEMREVLRQTLRALAYLHDEDITHRDIKPQNILVQSRSELFIKLCDLGLATDKRSPETRCGTFLYAAAEIYQKSSYSNAVDIWALGVVALQFTKGLPKCDSEIRSLEWCKRIRCGVEILAQPVDDPAVSLLKRMLELKPQDRPSAEACLADPWMISPQQCSQRGITSNVEANESLTISEQPTEILDPSWLVENPQGKLDHSLTLEESRKRARYSGSISGERNGQ